MPRSIDWVEQDTSNESLNWRQGKREEGDPLQYTDRRLNHTETVQKGRSKKNPQFVEAPKYSPAQQDAMKAAFKPLADALQVRYGNKVRWWHFESKTGILLWGDGSNERTQATGRDLIRLADKGFASFTAILSKAHGHEITPSR